MTLLNCEICNKQFEGTCGKFCSPYCRSRDWKIKNPERWKRNAVASEKRRVARRNGMTVLEWKEFLKAEADKEKQCPCCQKFFKSPYYGIKYCSSKCSGRAGRERLKARGYKPKSKPWVPKSKLCKWCGVEFKISNPRYRPLYCCSLHKRLFNQKHNAKKRREKKSLFPPIVKRCAECGTQINRGLKFKFCSKPCSEKSRHKSIKNFTLKRLQQIKTKGSHHWWAQRVRANINRSLKQCGRAHYKTCKSVVLLGCSFDFLKKHIESHFQPGMTWENYGLKGWHIDHKRPCDSFDLSKESDQKQCFHYSNLQPLWWRENLRKQAKWDGQTAMPL